MSLYIVTSFQYFLGINGLRTERQGQRRDVRKHWVNKCCFRSFHGEKLRIAPDWPLTVPLRTTSTSLSISSHLRGNWSLRTNTEKPVICHLFTTLQLFQFSFLNLACFFFFSFFSITPSECLLEMHITPSPRRIRPWGRRGVGVGAVCLDFFCSKGTFPSNTPCRQIPQRIDRSSRLTALHFISANTVAMT